MLKPNAYYDDMRKQGFGDEDGVLMNGISALIKETPQRPLTLSATQGNSENTQSMNQECFQDGAVLKNLPAGQELQEIWVRALG